ncbi:MAG: 3-phosphoglycerate dehydrogenase family protein [Thiotrichales bacterium]
MDKYRISTLNNIALKGLERLPRERYEVASGLESPQAILLRSHNLHEAELPESLLAVGRAGAGVNNIPVDKLSERGIPVFNAPGANANAVKELVLAALLIGSRNLVQAWSYTQSLSGDDEYLAQAVEEGKKQFRGKEIYGRTLGVIGLGAIGVRVANAARALGMSVVGFDPTITVERAWQLTSDVIAAKSVDEVFSQADFLTFHVPLLDSTRHLLNEERLHLMKPEAVVINFAREGIVDSIAVQQGLENKKIAAYVCDFPSSTLMDHPKVVTFPHLGASTAEAEENCAVMVADQLRDYLEYGIVRNAVNFPEVTAMPSGATRLCIVNENCPDMLGQISHWLGGRGLNIQRLINESLGDIAYSIVDLDEKIESDCCRELNEIEGVKKVRVL